MTSKSKPAAEELAVAELPSRLVYSLLKAVVRVAAKSNMPMAELTELTQLAYFDELRREHPRELSTIAEKLGLSLRSIGALNRRLRQAFFAAEANVQPTREVCSALLDAPLGLAELQAALPDLDKAQLRQALEFLKKSEWVEVKNRKYQLKSRLRSYVDNQLTRKIDGLNRQMDILSSSVWSRFVDNTKTSVGRSWVFAGKEADVVEFIESTIKSMRHGAVDMEESALESGDYKRYGVTFSISGVDS